MNNHLLSVEIRYEQDVVATRQRARQIAGLLGFPHQDQTGFATAVSEIARNAFRYGGGGRADFTIEGDPPCLFARVRDKGPGIANLPMILAGQHDTRTGMGMGIIGSKRLCDRFDVHSDPGTGTTVDLGKRLPKRATAAAPHSMAEIAAELARRPPQNPLEEVQQQNRELLQAMEGLRARQAEVERLNAELAETNRGVLALYAELDDKAESLRRASELKSRFLSDMSHELRTPLNAVISLSGLLLSRTDGGLTVEQEKQVGFIRSSAQSLGEMVNDLLDLAKIEAGKADLRLTEFQVSDVLLALRGMFRPLVGPERPVTLVVEDPEALVPVWSDEGKVSQILRNFISNALKFTERGEVRVRADFGADETVVFSVADTGVGVEARDRERIFEDFTQVDGPVQRRSRGTGLGLPLARKLAVLLGGEVSLSSEVGQGSTFYFKLPLICPHGPQPAAHDGERAPSPRRAHA
jgi:signal transduction histidine kinase